MTLVGVQQAIYRRLGYPDAPGTEVANRIREAINARYHALLSAPGMRRLREVQGAAFTSTANNPTVTLSPTPKVARILRLYETVNDTALVPRTLEWYRRWCPDPTAETGTPTAWVPVTEQTSGVASVQIYLWPTPSSSQTYAYDYDAALTDLGSQGDVPLLPVDFHDLLVLGVRADEYEFRDQLDRYVVAKRDYDQRLRELRVYLNGIAPATDPAPTSRLGPWYPAGT